MAVNRLSEEAILKLKKILKKEIGSKNLEKLDDNDFNEIGSLFLSIFAQSLKMK